MATVKRFSFVRHAVSILALLFLGAGVASCFSIASFTYVWKSRGDVKSLHVYSTGEMIAAGYQRLAEAYFAIPPGGPAANSSPPIGPSWHFRWRWMPIGFIRWWVDWHNISSKSPALYLFANGKIPKLAPSLPMFPVRFIQIAIPYWILLLLTIPITVFRLIDVPQERRRKRFSAGECVVCGYDLRHTPDRCPECGSMPPALQPERRKALGPFSRGVWFRIIFYPVLFALIARGFSAAYLWHF